MTFEWRYFPSGGQSGFFSLQLQVSGWYSVISPPKFDWACRIVGVKLKMRNLNVAWKPAQRLIVKLQCCIAKFLCWKFDVTQRNSNVESWTTNIECAWTERLVRWRIYRWEGVFVVWRDNRFHVRHAWSWVAQFQCVPVENLVELMCLWKPFVDDVQYLSLNVCFNGLYVPRDVSCSLSFVFRSSLLWRIECSLWSFPSFL